MGPEKCLSRHPLPNGLTLEFWDLSRPAAGDRWQVVVEARLAVPVIPKNLPPELQDKAEEVNNFLGPEITFAKQEIRHFVAAGEVADLLQRIASELFTSIQGYLGHTEFAARFIRKKYRDVIELRSWQQHMPAPEAD